MFDFIEEYKALTKDFRFRAERKISAETVNSAEKKEKKQKKRTKGKINSEK